MTEKESLPGDASDRGSAEAAVRASEEQLRFLTDHAPVSLAHCDHELHYRFVNQPYAEMFGLQVAEIVGKHTRDVLGEEAFAHAHPYMKAALDGQTIDYDLVLPIPSAAPRIVHVSYEPERDASGRVVGFLAAIIDITERKQAQEELVRLAAVVKHCGELVNLATLDGKMIFLN